MSWFNKIIGSLFAVLIAPFQELDPMWGLLWISGLTGMLVLFIYKSFSNQQEIEKVKNQLKSCLLALRLFQDDPVQMGKTVGTILAKNIRYFQLNLKPFMVMILPVVLIMIQMDLRFGHRPLHPGESTLLKVFWNQKEDYSKAREIQIETTGAIRIDTSPVYIPSKREVAWRICGLSAGCHPIHIKSPNGTNTQHVLVSSVLLPVASKSVSKGFWNELLHPGNPPLSSDFPAAVEIEYPSRSIHLFSDVSLHWIVLFFIATLCTGFALKGVLGIQI